MSHCILSQLQTITWCTQDSDYNSDYESDLADEYTIFDRIANFHSDHKTEEYFISSRYFFKKNNLTIIAILSINVKIYNLDELIYVLG